MAINETMVVLIGETDKAIPLPSPSKSQLKKERNIMTTKLATNTVKTINALRTARINEFEPAFAKANDYLYNILAEIYVLSVDLSSDSEVCAELMREAKEKYGLDYGTKKVVAFNKLALDVVFANDNKVPTQRISSYKRVLDTVKSDTEKNVRTKEEFIDYINENGGLEEVRREASGITQTAEEKAVELAAELEEHSVVANLALSEAAQNDIVSKAEENEVVAMVGIVRNGKIVWASDIVTSSDEKLGSKTTSFYNAVAKVELKAAKEKEAANKKAAEESLNKVTADSNKASKEKAKAEAANDTKKAA